MINFLCDAIAGSFAGFCLVITAQPFDTIKVRMQTNSSNKSLVRTTKNIVLKEGSLALYKGITPPLLLSFPVNSTLFAAYEQYMRVFKINRSQLQFKHWFLAGCYSGLVQSFVSAPAELLKILFQMQIEGQQKQFQSISDCCRKLFRKEGISSVFTGTAATIFRDVPQLGFYFLVFEYCKYRLLYNQLRDELSLLEQMLAGCIAGLVCISISYPQDVIKTKIQSEAMKPINERQFRSKFYDGGLKDCIQQIWEQEGIKGYFRGYTSCAIFYMVACAAQLTGYEQARIFLTKNVKQYI